MLISAKTLRNYTLDSLDGEIGRAKDFLFDDRHWTIRYLVAETGHWLPERQVLLSPYSIVAENETENANRRALAIHLTKKQVEASPSLESDAPVSRQFESNYYGYYGWPTYWGGIYAWGAVPYIERDSSRWASYPAAEQNGDAHLRSVHEISRYHIEAADGRVGHVEDVIVDDETWTIRYLVIDTHSWWPGKKVLISPRWATRISWEDQTLFLDHTRAAIKASPEYTEEALITREYENTLYSHYDRLGYWLDEEPVRPYLRST